MKAEFALQKDVLNGFTQANVSHGAGDLFLVVFHFPASDRFIQVFARDPNTPAVASGLLPLKPGFLLPIEPA